MVLMKKLNVIAIIFHIILPLIAFVIGCFLSYFQGIIKWLMLVAGIMCIIVSALYSFKTDKIIDGGTF